MLSALIKVLFANKERRKRIKVISILQPENLHIYEARGISWGANQIWYKDAWQRKSGCGPTTCANLICYLAKTQKNLHGLWGQEINDKTNMLGLMEELWRYITPTKGLGVNKTSIFAEGAAQFAKDKGRLLTPNILDIPPAVEKRPGQDKVRAFLSNAFSNNLPVAFLNLDNGKVKNLEYWHWVTLISLNENQLTTYMVDQGHKSEIDLELWLSTTKGGGGFVVLEAV